VFETGISSEERNGYTPIQSLTGNMQRAEKQIKHSLFRYGRRIALRTSWIDY